MLAFGQRPRVGISSLPLALDLLASLATPRYRPCLSSHTHVHAYAHAHATVAATVAPPSLPPPTAADQASKGGAEARCTADGGLLKVGAVVQVAVDDHDD